MSAPCPVDRGCLIPAHRLIARPNAEAQVARLREFVALVALLDNPGQPGAALVTHDDLAAAAREVLA